MNDADCAELCVHDFYSAHIWDVTATTVFFGLSSRVANVASMCANSERYLVVRLSKVR